MKRILMKLRLLIEYQECGVCGTWHNFKRMAGCLHCLELYGPCCNGPLHAGDICARCYAEFAEKVDSE